MQVTTEEIIYPCSDGQPMADSTIQYKLIVTIKEGCDLLLKDDQNVFIAADLLWYPVEGRTDISQAPDVMVVFGRPKGDRRSYLQFQRAEQEFQRAEGQFQRAEQEAQKVERLAAKLRELNIDPDSI